MWGPVIVIETEVTVLFGLLLTETVWTFGVPCAKGWLSGGNWGIEL